MKTSILFACALLMGSVAMAGSKTTKTAAPTSTSKVKLLIQDSETNETVPYASITITGNHTPATFQRAGLNGECVLNVAPGEYEVKVSSAGFQETKTMKVTAVKSKESNYTVVMEPIYIEKNHTF
jgi:hypothetical protein